MISNNYLFETKVLQEKVHKLNKQIDELRLDYYKVCKDEEISGIEATFEEIEMDITNVQLLVQNYCGLLGNVDNIDRLVEKFWLVENIGEEKPMLSQEEFCEQHFKNTYRRNEDGRFIVKLPMKDEQLGYSKHLANIRLNQLVKRLSKNATLQHLYQDFITEYENLDHMERVDDNSKPELEYYLPHHGGAVQQDTFDILVRFRKHPVAVIVDIQKMYRQILVDESQRDLLRILWKRNLSDSPCDI
ncbi:uncharacterized protein LOC118179546 [Stegodyphus dumicola]|uniref:uncharacterized protein LOC118179546 n=1 Tax=Stegodyphus dumicola TaxID=202533 RepID=UPI0015B042B6|nr:uncharacterized protein LOC118179546 [Stegodyphus dumicola]